jgi:hypothetical protein
MFRLLEQVGESAGAGVDADERRRGVYGAI